MSRDAKTGAEKLRSVVGWIDYMPEYFNDRFTAEQLIKLWEYGNAHSDTVAEFADSWTDEQIAEALK